ncbi:peptidase domain-containing ABC transporter [Glutamicibacter endophyticus]|uniref:peptidase domain-containing ABC transporter n=1 Tax=Glutamicibacter endophyticus TaxID=1522174 RepID=UPI003AF0DC9E
MSRLNVVLQTADTDCAPACLTALLRFRGRTAELSSVRAQMDPGRDGCSGLVIRQVASEWGVALKALLAEPEDLVTHLDQLPLPAIVHLSRQHYVVAERVRGHRVTLMDPAVGRRTLAAEELVAECSGMILVLDTEQSQPRVPDGLVQQRRSPLLRQTLGAVRKDLGYAGALSALLAFGGLALPVATGVIVDAMVAGGLSVSRWLLLGIGLALVMGVLALARSWVLASLQYRLAGSLSRRVSSTLFSRSLKFFAHRTVGDLMGRVESAHAIHALLSVTLLGAALDAVLTTGYLIALLVIAPPLALTTSLVIVLALGLSLWVAGRCAALRREEILVSVESSTLMVDSIGGIQTLRAFGAEETELERWQQMLTRRLTLTRSRARLGALSLTLLAALAIATPLLILVQATTLPGAGPIGQITPGTALGLMGLAAATLTPLTSLATQLVGAADLRPLLDRLEDLESGEEERTVGRAPARLRGDIELERVSFRHDRHGAPILNDISGSLPAGSKLCLMGPTGCGKTTLAEILAGLRTPSSGQVRYDGMDLQELEPKATRAQVGVVFQDNWLTRGTLREAVLAGRTGYSEREIWQALARAQLAQEVIALPLGLETRLGAAGAGLSGGQRQRLALARALLAEPRLLILDEPTSALDAKTERDIDQILSQLSITRIIVTHRLDVAADADEIWVMDQGKIIERGTPEQLARAAGWYASLQQRRLRT